jgi:hypothetical protein
MEKMFNEGNQIHNFMSGSGSGSVINYGSGSDFLTSYGSGSGSTSQKVTIFAALLSSQDPLSDPLLSGLKSLSLKTHYLSVPIGRCCGS